MNYCGFEGRPTQNISMIMVSEFGMNGQMKKAIWALYMENNGEAGKHRMAK